LTDLDTVGAGDSFFSGFSLSLASGLPAEIALHIGNAVAGVTVQKLHQTGTCSPQELLNIIESCDFTYNADAQTSIISSPFEAEVITPFERIAARPAIKYAVFDHDGTISVLRQGWETVMEECMVDAVSGGGKCSDNEREKIRAYCQRFIVKSTGIQTINQMVMLVDIVRRWGIVPEKDILTPKEYKDRYNDALMRYIKHRLQRVEAGELSPEDATIAGSISFLKTLAQAGVKIYLASGTDIDDVRHEAEILGYADCFTGGIYGSVGDVKNDPKRQVLRKILAEENVDTERLAIFGDGPVEMREARENGAIAFGIMSDEELRSGWNPSKRMRLIHAGADIIVPDFLEYEKIASFLLKK
nr:HAD family hydrolase [Bacteroidales bacterium]